MYMEKRKETNLQKFLFSPVSYLHPNALYARSLHHLVSKFAPKVRLNLRGNLLAIAKFVSCARMIPRFLRISRYCQRFRVWSNARCGWYRHVFFISIHQPTKNLSCLSPATRFQDSTIQTAFLGSYQKGLRLRLKRWTVTN